MSEGDRTIPTEAWDETHPDHDDWVRSTGRCYGDHDGCLHLVTARTLPPTPDQPAQGASDDTTER